MDDGELLGELLQTKNFVTVSDIIIVVRWHEPAMLADTTDVLAKFADFCRTSGKRPWNGKTLDLVKETHSDNVKGDGGIEALTGLLEDGYLSGISDLRLWVGQKVAQESMSRFLNLFQFGPLNDLRTLHFHPLLPEKEADIFWEEFAKSLPSANLSELQIFTYRHDSSGDKLATLLANQFALGHLRSLQWLVLQLINMGDDGVKQLATSFQTGHAENLEQLGFACNRIGDKGAESLATAFVLGKCPKLRFLNLRSNPIGGEGLTALANAFKSGHLSKLETVHLHQLATLGSTEAGMVEIAYVLEAGSLPCLTMMRIVERRFQFKTLPVLRDALENSYRRNPYLIASLWEPEGDDDMIVDPWVIRIYEHRQSNELRVQSLKELQDEEDVAGQHAKIFFCGDPRVGKTTLKITLTSEATLMNKTRGLFCGSSLPNEQEPTRGIEVTHVQTKGVTLAFWDLAGQHDYQVLHSAFTPDLNFAGGQATIFVIVCNARSFDKAKSQLEYWMRYISSNSRRGNPLDRRRRVFVVLNCFHGHRVPKAEVPRWKTLLMDCEKGFGMYLNVCTDLFIANLTSRIEVQSLKNRILKEAKAMLQSRKMPRLCYLVQEEGRRWMGSKGNFSYPVLTWREFKDQIGGGLLGEKKLEAAAEYLHEAGHIILFRNVILSCPLGGERSRTALEGEGLTLQGGLVIVDPEWFCKQVVGNLLLPKDMVRRAEDRLDVLQEEQGASIPFSTLEKNEFQVPKEKIDQVVVILSRLGICFRIKDRDDVIFVPALIQQVDESGWSLVALENDNGTRAWTMGFSLRVKNLKATLLPINVLRQVQVNIALDQSIGGRADHSYLARKFLVSFKFKRMCVLIEYSQKQDRIDVLVRPSVNGLSRKEQVNIAQEFVSMIKETVYDCAPGVELDKRIIRPWSVVESWRPIEERDIRVLVDTVTSGVEKKGKLEWMDWAVGEEPVGEGDVLSDEDLCNFLDIISRKLELTKAAVNQLTASKAEEITSRYEGTSSSSEASSIEVSSAFKHKDQGLLEALILHLDRRFSELLAGQRDIRETQRRNHADLMQLMEDVKGNIRKILERQTSFNTQIQNLERFSMEKLELSLPRFAFVTKKGERSWQMKLTGLMVETLLLRFLCEAKYDYGANCKIGAFHEVSHTEQEGIDVRKIPDWVETLLPMLVWTLKVTFVAVKIAGIAVLPGLGILFGDNYELSRALDKVTQMATGAADLTKYVFEALDGLGRQPLARDAGHRLKGESTSSSTQSWVPGNETQLRGEAKEAVRKVLNSMDERERTRKVGLIRVLLSSNDGGGEKHVAWICKECYEVYLRQNPPKAHAV